MAAELRLRVQHGRELLEVCLPLGASVGALKEELARQTSQLARSLRLIHKGKVLAADAASLSSLGVVNNDKLMLLSAGGAAASQQPPPAKRPAVAQPAVDAASLDARVGAWRATGSATLRDAGLVALPPAVCALGEALRTLDVCGNPGLRALPALSLLSRLTRLSADACGLTEVPWPSLPATLTAVSLAGNELTSFTGLAALVSLKKLCLARNQLRFLPADVGCLVALTTMDVSSNQLTGLPAELGGCAALEELNVSQNALSSLPAELGLCLRLCVLDASANVRLAAAGIPPALLRAPSLHTLLLQGCHVTLLQLRELDGYAELERRRQAKASQALTSVGAVNARENADAEMRRRAG